MDILFIYKIPGDDELCITRHLGCWKDDRYTRAIEGGLRFRSENPFSDCESYTRENGWQVFGVQFGKECFTAANAEETYQRHGETSGCSGGTGGFNIQDVYQIKCIGKRVSNYQDTGVNSGCSCTITVTKLKKSGQFTLTHCAR